MLALALTAAVVVGDGVALRAAPGREAAQQAVLWRGDWLEVRGERKRWLKVYDHRHERPGWIAQDHVRLYPLDESSSSQLAAVVTFLRDTPGAESLGIAHAALYLKVAPSSAIGSEVLTALGTMAERLARRVSSGGSSRESAVASAHLEVAQSWGVRFVSVEDGETTRTCYDGEAFRYVLALEHHADDRARAALALSDEACTPRSLGLTGRQADDEARLALIEQVDPTHVTGWLGNRLRIRRAQIAASLAWTKARRGDDAGAVRAAESAQAAFLRVDGAELADDDAAGYAEAALHVAASRWASQPARRPGPVTLRTQPDGSEGGTCVTLATGGPLRCTHGQIWTSSFRVAPDGASAALSVEPLPGWLELWLFRRGADGSWTVDVLPPATEGPDLGYVEVAGWSSDGQRALVVREARQSGAIRRSFEVIRIATLVVEHQTRRWADLGRFKSWASADWLGHTVALR